LESWLFGGKRINANTLNDDILGIAGKPLIQKLKTSNELIKTNNHHARLN
jgi:hypothetical protein